MSICSTANMPVGANGNCLKQRSTPDNIIIIEKGTTFSYDDVLNRDWWEELIQIDLKAYVPKKLTDYADNTDDIEITTTNTGVKFVGDRPIPEIDFMLYVNRCDYKELNKVLFDASYDVIHVTKDGTLECTEVGDGVFKGFSVRFTATGTPIATTGDTANAFRLKALYDSAEEFVDIVYFNPTWSPISVLPLLMPTGISVLTLSAYSIASGEQTFKLAVRCGDPLTGVTSNDFEVSPNGIDAGITDVVEDSAGKFILTIEKDISGTPIPLADGDSVQIRYKTADAISSYFTIEP